MLVIDTQSPGQRGWWPVQFLVDKVAYASNRLTKQQSQAHSIKIDKGWQFVCAQVKDDSDAPEDKGTIYMDASLPYLQYFPSFVHGVLHNDWRQECPGR